ncbi:iron complex transport system permease protein [Pseudomonas psychrotolerans]|nr:iron complex transport system permease protein [Pseudomonas psychrotolerans]
MSRHRFAPRRSARFKACLLLLGLAAIGICALSLTGGAFAPAPHQVVATLLGQGDALTRLILLDLRLPRLLAAFGVGAALGASGAIFQRLARNPLASPDLVGFTVGSASGALITLLWLQLGGAALMLGALTGGLLAAVLVAGLAALAGIRGERMILLGIAISALLASLNEYLLTRAELDQAQEARLWLFGSLDMMTWSRTLGLLAGCLLLLPLAAWLARRLRLLELGDDLARALGLPVLRSQNLLLAVAVALAAPWPSPPPAPSVSSPWRHRSWRGV